MHEKQKWCKSNRERRIIGGHVNSQRKCSVNTVKKSVFNNDVLRPSVLADRLTALACGCPGTRMDYQPLSALKNTMAALVSEMNQALTLVAGKPMRNFKLKVPFLYQSLPQRV